MKSHTSISPFRRAIVAAAVVLAAGNASALAQSSSAGSSSSSPNSSGYNSSSGSSASSNYNNSNSGMSSSNSGMSSNGSMQNGSDTSRDRMSSNNNSSNSSDWNNSSSSSRSSDKLSWSDKRFVTKAADDGQDEVQLAQLAAQKASNPDVRNFAQQLVQDHTQVNSELMSIASTKNVKLDKDNGQDRTYRRLSKASGNEFDREFIEHMVDEHEKDIKLFEKAASNAKDTEVRQFASKHVDHLRQHLAQAQQLQQSIVPTGRTGTDSWRADSSTNSTDSSNNSSTSTGATGSSSASGSDSSGTTGHNSNAGATGNSSFNTNSSSGSGTGSGATGSSTSSTSP